VIQGAGAQNRWAAAQRAADWSGLTEAVWARSQLAATLGAADQSGLVSKPARGSGKKGSGPCTNQSTVVVVEPGISKHERNRGVQMSNKECYHEGITSRVTDSQIHGVGNP